MDSTIVAAIITAIATIIAAFIARWKNLERLPYEKEIPEKTIRIDKQQTLVSSEYIDKNFVIGVFLTLACAVLFGANHVLGKYVIDSNISPLVVVILRNLIAGLVILIVAIIVQFFSYESKNINITFNKDSYLMIMGRSFSGIFYFASFLYLSATKTIILYKLNPIYTFILLLFIMKYRLSNISFANILIGTLVAIIGSLVTLTKFGITIPSSSNEVIGIPLIILAGIFWSVYVVFSEKHENTQIKRSSFVERQKYISYIYLISTVPLIFLFFLIQVINPKFVNIISLKLTDIIKILPLGLISGIIGILYFEALKRVSSLLVSVLISLEIFFTMIFEYSFLHHEITWNVFIGSILVIIGAISVGRESKKLKLG